MTAVLGAGLLFAAAQTVLVDATPATVDAAEQADGAEFGQTRVANESTRASTQPLRSAQSAPAPVACGYPDDCDSDDAPPTLPSSQDCEVSDFGPLSEAPYLRVEDSCTAERAALDAASCALTETVGIGDDTYSTSDPSLPNALANRGFENTSRYQLYTCPGGAEVTLTSAIPLM